MASDLKEAHVVEIAVDEEHQHKIITAMHHHPLLEISQSPGHLLLLKLWQREEDLSGRRIALRETRMDSIKRDIFQLCCFFFMFHAFYLTLLFTSSVDLEDRACKKWWIPMVLLASTSIAIVFLVQVKLWRYWKVNRQLQREKSDGRAVGRCIQELRMKGASFDLSKEPQNSKRMKSSSVEIKWRPLVWCSHYLITICLVCFTGASPFYCFLLQSPTEGMKLFGPIKNGKLGRTKQREFFHRPFPTAQAHEIAIQNGKKSTEIAFQRLVKNSCRIE